MKKFECRKLDCPYKVCKAEAEITTRPLNCLTGWTNEPHWHGALPSWCVPGAKYIDLGNNSRGVITEILDGEICSHQGREDIHHYYSFELVCSDLRPVSAMLPKLTIGAIADLGIEWPEWAECAIVNRWEEAHFCAIHGPEHLQIPGKWDATDCENSIIMRPKKATCSAEHEDFPAVEAKPDQSVRSQERSEVVSEELKVYSVLDEVYEREIRLLIGSAEDACEYLMSVVIVALAATTVYYRYTSRMFCHMYQQQYEINRKASLDALSRWARNVAATASAVGFSVEDAKKSLKAFHTAAVDTPRLLDAVSEIYRNAPKINGAVDLSYIGDRLHDRGIMYQGQLSKLIAAHGYDVFRDPKHCGGIPCVVHRKTT